MVSRRWIEYTWQRGSSQLANQREKTTSPPRPAETYYRSKVFTVKTTGMWAGWAFVGGLSCELRDFNSFLELHPLGASKTRIPYLWNQTCFQILPYVPWGTKLHLVDNYYSIYIKTPIDRTVKRKYCLLVLPNMVCGYYISDIYGECDWESEFSQLYKILYNFN